MSSQVVVGAQGQLAGAARVRRCEGDPHHAAHVASGQPAFLVVVVAVQLPALLLRQ